MRWPLGLSLAFLVAASAAFPAAPTAAVAILHTAEWAPADAARAGAGEFQVWLRVAQLQRDRHAAGLVVVGDHNGVLRSGGERALGRVVFAGVVVVKLARNGEVAATPDGLFIDGGHLSADHAAHALTRALERYGPPPAAADPDRPTPGERQAIRRQLANYAAVFAREPGIGAAVALK